MIEIITEPVEMPPFVERRYQKDLKKNKWEIMDMHNEGKVIYRSRSYENTVLACHNLNKKFYRNHGK